MKCTIRVIDILSWLLEKVIDLRSQGRKVRERLVWYGGRYRECLIRAFFDEI